MDAQARNLEKIFDRTIQYQIPLFQRPYVWDTDKGWQTLWEDIEDLLNKQLLYGKVHPHFLGAAVLEQLSNATGGVETRQIIDGQQRFTTLQIFMMVCRDQAGRLNSEKYQERFADLVCNRENRIDREEEACKVWPTNSDRAAYRLVQTSGSCDALERQLHLDPAQGKSNIVGAYRYFSKQLESWFDSDPDPDRAEPNRFGPNDRLDALWKVVRANLLIVVIDLDNQDEAQVIFETMNALGEPLLPADLIKNFLFRRASSEGADIEKLYHLYWADFDRQEWRTEIKQGRTNRPFIDIFINHYLALMTQDDVKSTHLFGAFKTFVIDNADVQNALVARPHSALEHMATLAKFGRIYRAFRAPSSQPRLATFLERLEAVDTTTVYPFLLLAHERLVPDNQAEFDKVLSVLESFLVRRMVCELTPKNYNRLFIDLIRAMGVSGEVSANNVAAWFAKNKGDSQRFPPTEEFARAVLTKPLYDDLAQYKVRAVLEAIDRQLENPKSEALPLPHGLTIEHVMPQDWATHWPLPEDALDDPVKAQEAKLRRNVLIHTLGNLTLITGSLNPALSKGPWRIKRPELLKFSKLNLTRYFHDDKKAGTWNEAAIMERGIFLAAHMSAIWPDLAREPESLTA